LPLLALFVTAAHFLIVFGYTPLARRILSSRAELQVQYVPGRGAVENIVQTCSGLGFTIQDLALEQPDGIAEGESRAVHMQLLGRGAVEALLVAVSDIEGVISARTSPSSQAKE
jgi:putative Mg2+ transporter-C (MgtC) family protein